MMTWLPYIVAGAMLIGFAIWLLLPDAGYRFELACSAFSFVGIVVTGVGILVVSVLCILIGRGLAP